MCESTCDREIEAQLERFEDRSDSALPAPNGKKRNQGNAPRFDLRLRQFLFEFGEDAGSVPVVLRASTTGSIAPTRDFDVRLRTVADSARSSDYAPLDETLTFSASDFALQDGRYVLTLSTTLSILDDSRVERSEVLRLEMDLDALPEHVQAPDDSNAPAGAWVEIQDNAAATVGFAEAELEVEEGDAVLVEIVLDTVVKYSFTLNLMMIAHSATEGVDYEFDTIAVEFNPYVNRSAITVRTLEDTLDEDDESFELRLVAASEDLNIGISSRQAFVAIRDDDEPLP